MAEMGTIELRAYRSQPISAVEPIVHLGQGLHHGRISERSKKAGWHHVTYVTVAHIFPDTLE
jgi:hypothetical protein